MSTKHRRKKYGIGAGSIWTIAIGIFYSTKDSIENQIPMPEELNMLMPIIAPIAIVALGHHGLALKLK